MVTAVCAWASGWHASLVGRDRKLNVWENLPSSVSSHQVQASCESCSHVQEWHVSCLVKRHRQVKLLLTAVRKHKITQPASLHTPQVRHADITASLGSPARKAMGRPIMPPVNRPAAAAFFQSHRFLDASMQQCVNWYLFRQRTTLFLSMRYKNKYKMRKNRMETSNSCWNQP